MFKTNCSQRGCVGSVNSEKPPKLCPVCHNPLLKGDVTQVTVKAAATNPPGPVPESTPAPTPEPTPAPTPAPTQEN